MTRAWETRSGVGDKWHGIDTQEGHAEMLGGREAGRERASGALVRARATQLYFSVNFAPTPVCCHHDVFKGHLLKSEWAATQRGLWL